MPIWLDPVYCAPIGFAFAPFASGSAARNCGYMRDRAVEIKRWEGGRGKCLKNDRLLISRYSIKNVKRRTRAMWYRARLCAACLSPGKNSLSMVRAGVDTTLLWAPVDGVRRINQATSLVRQRRRSVIRRVHYRDVNNSPFGAVTFARVLGTCHGSSHSKSTHVNDLPG